MIDTIVMVIPEMNFKILDYDAFNPSARNVFEPPYYKLSHGYISCVQNPTQKDKNEKIYKPRLTISKRLVRGGYSIALKIELSVPKLLFNNNFQELEDSDFEKVITVLQKRLYEMSVLIDEEVLKRAEIAAIHYGKNVILTNATASLIINMLKKFDISQRLDEGDTDFRNDGQAIRYHTNSYELSFYDKMKDLEKAKISEKRAIEDDNYTQYDLFTPIVRKKNEILRMELRLNNRKKIGETLRRVGVNPKAMQFDNLFHKEIARRCLLYFWNKFITPSQGIVSLSVEDNIVTYHKLKNAGVTDTNVLKALGLLSLIKSDGVRAFKQMENRKGNVFCRTKKVLDGVASENTYLLDVFDSIKATIEKMASIRDLKGLKL